MVKRCKRLVIFKVGSVILRSQTVILQGTLVGHLKLVMLKPSMKTLKD